MEASNEINELINKKTNNKEGKAQFMRLDLSDLQSVIDFSDRIKEQFQRIDILINNAGLNVNSVLPSGIQQIFQVNYLGHYLLTRSLIPLLSTRNNDLNNNNDDIGRVINLSSVMHHLGQVSEYIDNNNLQQ